MSDAAATAQDCDVLVIGSGAGGLSTAITAKKAGLDVVIIEKEPFFGGTTAYSGGVLWIPGNPHAAKSGVPDSRDAALTYLRNETGNFFDEAAIEAFLDVGPRMLDFFERETEAKFVLSAYPDYHPDVEGGAQVGRSVTAAPYDARRLGREIARLRPPLETITFIGMMFNSSNADLKHFFRATKSLTSAIYVGKRLANHLKDLALYRRGVQITSGNALVARLAKTVFDLGIPLLTETAAEALVVQDGRVTGANVRDRAGTRRLDARKAVVLAAGGFPQDLERIAKAYPHVARGARHVSPTPAGNTGDGIRMAEAAGASFDVRFPNAAAWMPVSEVPLGGGRTGAFPHLVDRYKPGIIAVNRHGRRFANESNSYHDTGEAMIRDGESEPDTGCWLVCDHRTIRKYGLGHAKPAPVPVGIYTRNGYLQVGSTLADLARAAGIDAEGLAETVRAYNVGAERGEDPEFGRGSTAFNRFLGDPDHRPNPNVAPIGKGPFYALRLVMGDLGTFDGLKTDIVGRVLRRDSEPVPGLYAVGNDRASVMGGNYPGAGITLGPPSRRTDAMSSATRSATARTQVAIVGAGPAGLMLSHLLHLAGIRSVVVESRSRDVIEATIRAGVLEQNTVDLMVETGIGERLRREGFNHHGFNFRFAGETRRIDLHGLTGGRSVTVYPQHEVLKDLIAARLEAGGEIVFGATDVSIEGLTSSPLVRFKTAEGEVRGLAADFVAGCDGSYGPSRDAMPEGGRKDYVRVYPFGWFGILTEAPPSSDELIYARHDRGFALISTRSPGVQRMYFQCDPAEKVEAWSSDRIWEELQTRVEGDGFRLKEGPIFQKNVVPMRSYVREPMQHGRLFIAGDAAHTVPPTGAKGLNLAVADVFVLARAFERFYRSDETDGLDGYSQKALRRVWRAQHFSYWMTSMLHRFEGATEFDLRRQIAELDLVTTSENAARTIAENYAGLPLS